MWGSLLCKEWDLCITNLFISKESLLYKLLFRVSKGSYILGYAISPLSVTLHSTHSLLSKLMCFTCFSILKIVGLRVKLVWSLVFDDKSTWFCLFLYRTCILYLAFYIAGSVKDQRRGVQQKSVLLIVHTEDTQAIVRVSLQRRRKVETISL